MAALLIALLGTTLLGTTAITEAVGLPPPSPAAWAPVQLWPRAFDRQQAACEMPWIPLPPQLPDTTSMLQHLCAPLAVHPREEASKGALPCHCYADIVG